jgi:SAM-dependent methyltransferase
MVLRIVLGTVYTAMGVGQLASFGHMPRIRPPAARVGRDGRATGDAEQLPYPESVFDVAVCECAPCTFPDKTRAAAEFARVLRPGGRLGITDVTVDPARLPPELTGLGARIACVADARPLQEYVEILAGAGLRTLRTERHAQAMLRMIDQIEARLNLLRMTGSARLTAAGVDLDTAPGVLRAARTAVEDGALGYSLLIAERTPE